MTDTEKILEKHTKEVIIEQIDICLSGQDPRYQLGRYVEKLREEIIHQALAEERERVVGLIEKIRVLEEQSNQALDHLQDIIEKDILASLQDKPLTDK